MQREQHHERGIKGTPTEEGAKRTYQLMLIIYERIVGTRKVLEKVVWLNKTERCVCVGGHVCVSVCVCVCACSVRSLRRPLKSWTLSCKCSQGVSGLLPAASLVRPSRVWQRNRNTEVLRVRSLPPRTARTTPGPPKPEITPTLPRRGCSARPPPPLPLGACWPCPLTPPAGRAPPTAGCPSWCREQQWRTPLCPLHPGGSSRGGGGGAFVTPT